MTLLTPEKPLPFSAEIPADITCLALIAGEGELPPQVAQQALALGLKVVAVTSDGQQLKTLAHIIGRQNVSYVPVGQLDKGYQVLKSQVAQALVFVGKVNKWAFLRNPSFDKRALSLYQQMKNRSDDHVMLLVIEDVEKEGFQVLRQDIFLKPLFLQKGVYTQRQPNAEDQSNIELALDLAKASAAKDIGQTAIVSKGMVIAIEAIEGTDRAILRSKEWVQNKGGVVAKVEKPNQDLRFDIPTVGLRTLKNIKKAGMDILAIEADKTLVLNREELIAFANRHNMLVLAV